MTHDHFKRIFGEIAANFGFERAYGGWFLENPETVVVLDLQKSNHSDSYYLNIKIYVQGLFGNKYRKSKNLVKRDVGDVFMRASPAYRGIFDMESHMSSNDRVERLQELFQVEISPKITLGSTREGLREAERNGLIYLLPAVKKALDDLDGESP